VVKCPICKEEGFERGMQIRGQWICSDCVHEIAVAHCKMVNDSEEIWKELKQMKF
jgi:ribosomal protein L37AE/L43A